MDYIRFYVGMYFDETLCGFFDFCKLTIYDVPKYKAKIHEIYMYFEKELRKLKVLNWVHLNSAKLANYPPFHVIILLPNIKIYRFWYVFPI